LGGIMGEKRKVIKNQMGGGGQKKKVLKEQRRKIYSKELPFFYK